jgi:hypothetical protein
MTLEISFADKSLRQLCENGAIAKRKLGNVAAEKLKHRLADLRAVSSVKDLVAGKPREVEGTIIVDLCNDHRIILCANHNSNPLLHTGSIDWSKVNRVKILRIEVNHE